MRGACPLHVSVTSGVCGGRAPRMYAVAASMVERVILAVRNDFGCLVIIVAFVVIMISTIVFANIITPPSNNPFV